VDRGDLTTNLRSADPQRADAARIGGDEQLFDKPPRDRRPTRDPIAAPGRSVEFA
jgi:hypothetical protein